MKKFICFTVFLLLFFLGKNSQAQDFRGAKWYISKEEVIRREGRKPEEAKENLLGYTTKTVSTFYNVPTIYVFNDEGHLIGGLYIIKTSLSEFDGNVKKLTFFLEQKYGKPAEVTSNRKTFIGKGGLIDINPTKNPGTITDPAEIGILYCTMFDRKKVLQQIAAMGTEGL